MAEFASATICFFVPLNWIAYATRPCFHWISAAAHDAPQLIGRKRPVIPRASDTLRLMSSPAPRRPKNAATKQAVTSWQPRAAQRDRWYWPEETSSIAPCTRDGRTPASSDPGSRTAIPLFDRTFGSTELSFDGTFTGDAATAGTANTSRAMTTSRAWRMNGVSCPWNGCQHRMRAFGMAPTWYP